MPKTLSEAKDRFDKKLKRDFRAKCPLCNRVSIIYKRVIDKTMATTLMLWAKEHGNSYIHVRKFLEGHGLESQARGGSFTKLRHWRLIESKGKHSGYWRITERGFAYLKGKKLYKVALVANNDGDLIGFLAEEGKASISDALNTSFKREKI